MWIPGETAPTGTTDPVTGDAGETAAAGTVDGTAEVGGKDTDTDAAIFVWLFQLNFWCFSLVVQVTTKSVTN